MFLNSIFTLKRIFRLGFAENALLLIFCSVYVLAPSAEARRVVLCQQLVNESETGSIAGQTRSRFQLRPEIIENIEESKKILASKDSPCEGCLAPEALKRVAENFKATDSLPEILNAAQLDLFQTTGLIHQSFDIGPAWLRDPQLALTVGRQSKSIIRRDLGLDVVRDYTWLRAANNEPNLDRIHIARNYRGDGKPFSLEMFLFDGREWQAYLFRAEGAYWRMVDKFEDSEVSLVCLKCHISKGFGRVPYGKLSPNPFFMRDEKAWFRSGFSDTDLVRRLLKF